MSNPTLDSSAAGAGSSSAAGGAATANGAAAAAQAAINAASSTTVPAAAANVVPDDTRDINSRLAYVPRDARLMALILQEMGVQDVQPPALMMLLEFAQRYTHEVLQDALVYADHANSAKATSQGVSTLTIDDVQLAVQSRVNHSFTSPPSKDVLLSLASTVNAIPLPPISDRYGVKLPPAQHCLTNVNFSIVPNPPPPDEDDDDEDGERDDQSAAGAGDEDERQGRADAVEEVDDDEDDEMDMNEGDLSSAKDSSTLPSAVEARGTKRSLEEDEEYD